MVCARTRDDDAQPCASVPSRAGPLAAEGDPQPPRARGAAAVDLHQCQRGAGRRETWLCRSILLLTLLLAHDGPAPNSRKMCLTEAYISKSPRDIGLFSADIR